MTTLPILRNQNNVSKFIVQVLLLRCCKCSYAGIKVLQCPSTRFPRSRVDFVVGGQLRPLSRLSWGSKPKILLTSSKEGVVGLDYLYPRYGGGKRKIIVLCCMEFFFHHYAPLALSSSRITRH